MRKAINSATVFTHGGWNNSSVGIPSVSFNVELYINEMASDEYLSEIRQQLKDFYEGMTGDDCSVGFDFEIQEEQEAMEAQEREEERLRDLGDTEV